MVFPFHSLHSRDPRIQGQQSLSACEKFIYSTLFVMILQPQTLCVPYVYTCLGICVCIVACV